MMRSTMFMTLMVGLAFLPVVHPSICQAAGSHALSPGAQELARASRWMKPAARAQLLQLKPGVFALDFDGTIAKISLGGKDADASPTFIRFMLEGKHYPARGMRRVGELFQQFIHDGGMDQVKQGVHGTSVMAEMVPWMVRGLAGMKEVEVQRLADRVARERILPFVYRPMAELIRGLVAAEHHLWIVSAGMPHWLGVSMAHQLGIPTSNVIGPKVYVSRRGILGDEYVLPDPIGQGKVDRLLQETADEQVGGGGDSSSDLQLIERAHFRLAINPAGSLADTAKTRRWHIETLTPAQVMRPDLLAP